MNKGRVALITGASVGIGRAVALKLASEGKDLILLDIDSDGLEAVKADCERMGVGVWICACDVSSEEQVNEAVRVGLERFKRIDILVNNAALWRASHPFLEISVAEWTTYWNVNVMGVVYLTRAVLGQMIENGYGRIINVASVAGVYGNAKMSCYSATKGAIISFTKALAKEVAEQGITVNSVSPGTVSNSDEGDENYVMPSSMSYMGRTGTGAENANLIAFLASEGAGYISGQNIQIDGCRKRI